MSNLKCDIRVIAIDCTDQLTMPETVRLAGGKIVEAWLLNVARHIHCCELTPSYELHFLYHEAAGEMMDLTDDENNTLGEGLNELNAAQFINQQEISYIHVRNVDLSKAIPVATVTQEEWDAYLEEHFDEFADHEDPEDQVYLKYIEEQLEHCNANHYI